MIPNLLNAIMVEIKQINQSETNFSNHKKEPSLHITYSPAFRIPAIMIHKATKMIREATGAVSLSRELEGPIIDADGYIIVRKIDLQTLSKTLALNDRIISYGIIGSETSCKFYLVGFKEAAQYSDIGTHTLEQWFFQDRS
jgi:hypothetical protein